MNCPQCHQMVGHDEHSQGRWIEERNDLGDLERIYRIDSIRCSVCGVFEVEMAPGPRVLKVHGPYRSTKNIRRVEKQIPAAKLHAFAACTE